MYIAKQVLIYLALFIAVVSVYEFIRIKLLANKSSRLIESAVGYEQSLPDPKQQILVLGDSTGVGTGTSDTKFSLAGRLGEQLPKAAIQNKAENGKTTSELLEEVKASSYSGYDFVLIHIGGNDIIRFKDLDQAAKNIQEMLDALAPDNKQIAVFTTGDMGDSDFFPILAKPIMTARSKGLRTKVKELVGSYDNVAYVDLFTREGNLKSVDGYATDKLHLSDAGYALWYAALKKTLQGTSFEL